MKRSLVVTAAVSMILALTLTSCSTLLRTSSRRNSRDDDDDEEESDYISEFLDFCEDDLDAAIVRQKKYYGIMRGTTSSSDIDNGMASRLDEDTAMDLIFANGRTRGDRPVPDGFEQAGAYTKITDDGYGLMTATLIEFEDEDDAFEFLDTAADFYSDIASGDAFNCSYVEQDDLVVATTMPYGTTYSEIAFFAKDNYVLMIANAYDSNTFYAFEETDEIADFFGFDAPSSYKPE